MQEKKEIGHYLVTPPGPIKTPILVTQTSFKGLSNRVSAISIAFKVATPSIQRPKHTNFWLKYGISLNVIIYWEKLEWGP